jgi:hypothetical protein
MIPTQMTSLSVTLGAVKHLVQRQTRVCPKITVLTHSLVLTSADLAEKFIGEGMSENDDTLYISFSEPFHATCDEPRVGWHSVPRNQDSMMFDRVDGLRLIVDYAYDHHIPCIRCPPA